MNTEEIFIQAAKVYKKCHPQEKIIPIKNAHLQKKIRIFAFLMTIILLN